MVGLLVRWFVGCSVCWLFCRLIDSLVGRLVDKLIGWSVGSSAGLLVVFFVWLVKRFVGRTVRWLVDCLLLLICWLLCFVG